MKNQTKVTEFSQNQHVISLIAEAKKQLDTEFCRCEKCGEKMQKRGVRFTPEKLKKVQENAYISIEKQKKQRFFCKKCNVKTSKDAIFNEQVLQLLNNANSLISLQGFII